MEEIFCPAPTELPCKSKEVLILELLSLIIGIPSTTYKGLNCPRTLTNNPAPGVPDALRISIPDTFP